MKILVLGHKGMLGNAVSKYLSNSLNHEIVHIEEHWPSPEFKEKVGAFDGNWIVNCIGHIPQKHVAEQTSDLRINYELPIWLESYEWKQWVRIFHPGTDCEMDDDFYGKSKKIASDYIKAHGRRTIIIKTSIIGHELNGQTNSLLGWFLNEESVYGFTQALWNGNTTLEWAKFCEQLMIDDLELYPIENVLHSHCISKYELLLEINKAYDKEIEVKRNDKDMPNKCLTGGFEMKPIYEQLKELREFYDN